MTHSQRLKTAQRTTTQFETRWPGTVDVLIILYSYSDETRDPRSNMALCLREFPKAKSKDIPKAKGYIWSFVPSKILIQTV